MTIEPRPEPGDLCSQCDVEIGEQWLSIQLGCRDMVGNVDYTTHFFGSPMCLTEWAIDFAAEMSEWVNQLAEDEERRKN